METQIRILRSGIDPNRIVPNPPEKAELLRLVASLHHNVSEAMDVVRPETYREWVLQQARNANMWLDDIKTTWVTYYETLRPYRRLGINNHVLDNSFEPKSYGVVRCKQQLGGIIKTYYCEAAWSTLRNSFPREGDSNEFCMATLGRDSWGNRGQQGFQSCVNLPAIAL